MEANEKPINDPVFKEYIDKLPKCLRGIHIEVQRTNHNWKIHEGDLVVDGNWQVNNINLIITGNLHVRGIYDGYSKGYSFVVVLGDMTAEHILCWYGLSVVGNLTVNGLINIEHYALPFETAGDLRARHMSIHHYQRLVHWNGLFVDSTCGEHTTNSVEQTLKTITPGLLASSIIEDGLDSLIVAFNASLHCLLNGRSPFREIQLSSEIVEKIIQYMDEGNEEEYSQEYLADDMKLDPLLALVIANYQELTDENIQYLQIYSGLVDEEFDKAIEITLEKLS